MLLRIVALYVLRNSLVRCVSLRQRNLASTQEGFLAQFFLLTAVGHKSRARIVWWVALGGFRLCEDEPVGAKGIVILSQITKRTMLGLSESRFTGRGGEATDS